MIVRAGGDRLLVATEEEWNAFRVEHGVPEFGRDFDEHSYAQEAALERFGVSVPAGEIKIENVAAVLVTAELPAYARPGARIDVTASSVGDARSLQGGTLLATPLRGGNGQIYALAQGPLSLGGFGGGSGGVVVHGACRLCYTASPSIIRRTGCIIQP